MSSVPGRFAGPADGKPSADTVLTAGMVSLVCQLPRVGTSYCGSARDRKGST